MSNKFGDVISALAATLKERADAGADNSYTAKLLADGPMRIAKKLGEEGVELALAGAAGSDDEVVSESADLIYHWLVLLQARGISPDEVANELERRFAQSGLTEKASRGA